MKFTAERRPSGADITANLLPGSKVQRTGVQKGGGKCPGDCKSNK